MVADAEVPVTLEFDLTLATDPLGADLTVAVPDAPSDEARQALLDGIERSLVGAQGNLVFQAIQQAHGTLSSYGASNDYDTESIVESFAGVDTERDRTSIHVSWAWDHEAAGFYEFGTPDHTVNGEPVLVFEFSASKYPYLDEMFPDGTAFLPQTNPSGLPESRFVRSSLDWLRREVGQ